MKIKTLMIISTLTLGLSFQSCEKDESLNNIEDNNSSKSKSKTVTSKSSTDILGNINQDIINGVNYEEVTNPYSYSGEYLLATLRDIHNQNSTAYTDETFLFDEMEENLIEYGYSQTKVQNLLSDIQDIEEQQTSIQTVVTIINADEANNNLQLDLFSGMVNNLQLITSFSEMTRISNIYTHHINLSTVLSDKEKKDLLTVTSDMIAIADFGDESNWSSSMNASSTSDTNYITNVPTACSCGPSGKLCATSFMVPFLSGAAMGNGAGAVVGFFAGMATAYGNGCMD